MAKVSINAPKTPVTEGSNGVAAATVPNVCKMPGPPAPFVPTPLPNIGRSGDSPKGYSKRVFIEGKRVAIRGSSFGSQGDIASKGTGGGLISSNTHGPTKFIGPGSMDVKIEGKNVQLLGDPMLNNCGPSGSPANAATLVGLVQSPDVRAALDTEKPTTECPGGGAHVWEVRPAQGSIPMESKIEAGLAKKRKGYRFEAEAAVHNHRSGELTMSSQLSGDAQTEKVIWQCSLCVQWREGDQLHAGPTPGSPPVAVEVKSKPKLMKKDLQQLGRNIQAVKQGGASGLVYKIPATSKYDFSAGQVLKVCKTLGCPVRVVRV